MKTTIKIEQISTPVAKAILFRRMATKKSARLMSAPRLIRAPNFFCWYKKRILSKESAFDTNEINKNTQAEDAQSAAIKPVAVSFLFKLPSI